MAKPDIEAQFLAIWLHDALAGKDTAVRIIGHIKAEVFEHEEIAQAYQFLVDKFAKGDPLDDLESETRLTEILGPEWYAAIQAQSKKGGKTGDLTRKVLFNYRARKQAAFLARAADEAAQLVGVADEKAAALADSAISKLATFHTTQGDHNRPVTQAEITDRALQRVRDRGTVNAGIPFPYQKMVDEMGNMLPGDLIAIAGYSNSGKSLLVANLWAKLAVMGVPTVSFPTEMGLAWHARAVAAHANVPQMMAEREQWDRATQTEIESYEFALQDIASRPWEIVDKPSISVNEIIARASVLRRRFAGKTVVVIVDHMHRLDYGNKQAETEVGPATKKLRNWAVQDDMGGIILCLLYQPRKPDDDIMLYRPVEGYQIKGVSEVWNEIDFLISPYRRWVKTDMNSLTPWGTKATLYDAKGWPMVAAPKADGAKVDDERVYLKIGKRRTGGEGPTMVLPIHSPSGQIYEIVKPKLAIIGGST